MVKFTCLYCLREYLKKSHYISHHKTCERKFNEVITLYKNYTKENLMAEYNNIIIGKKKILNKHQCDICGTIYSTHNGLKHHKKQKDCNTAQESFCDRIKKKYEDNDLNIKINENIPNTIILNDTSNSNNTINSNNTNNTNIQTQNNNTQINVQNNIKLVPYNDIKYDYMSPDVLINAFEIPGKAFESITADTFFHPKRKENHVIFCPNLKDDQIHVYNGNLFTADGWEYMEKKEFFREMLKKQMETLKTIYEQNEMDDNPLELRNLTGFINLLKHFYVNNEVIKEYTERLNTLCYEKNKVAKNTSAIKNK